MTQVFVVMGVAGSGKSTLGRQLAASFGCSFFDADDFHPAANVARMAAGLPLDDALRGPWLARLRALLAGHLARGAPAVLACSALKRAYREQLSGGDARVVFIFLDGSYELVRARLAARSGHFMPEGLLRSQFATLEPPGPDEALVVGIDRPVADILAAILQAVDPDDD